MPARIKRATSPAAIHSKVCSWRGVGAVICKDLIHARPPTFSFQYLWEKNCDRHHTFSITLNEPPPAVGPLCARGLALGPGPAALLSGGAADGQLSFDAWTRI